ncbi:hypothetical protein E0Z10_g5339 [Xylaria hypoxylon]|uniref:Spindle pole body-associated protein cut12 domain-containing protein n=1 Tax=Xylaria hypoxylon TaxID=37992 RepID=A0A4Z0YIX3_9PEZI|nr:hypothetical protein E0Z10_g5339 [Xylaria hypoxylon]
MLGWALKRGFQGATGLRDAPEGIEDTTQFDAPDTPAPVFAARAIRNAIWGQSATTEDHPPARMKPNETKRVEPAQDATTTTKAIPEDTRSPNKLNSILLTPGTATSRRKRVSFGQDVKAANNVDSSPLAASSSRNGRLRRKTTLQQALENSRPTKSKLEPQVEKPDEEDTEEEWEWEDDDICCNHDVTVDLNEPHSESGKYWKAEWSRYREEAKSDIEQLVKYKANAKSFAAKKDMEASQLTQKLKGEQAKVVEMEEKMANMATKLAATRKYGTDKDSASISKDLAKQTSLVTEYRERVKDLETRLKEVSSKSNLNRPSHQRINTSPRTEQNIIEVNRELRKARSELRQMDRLRDEAKRLKSNLATSRERVAELEVQASAGETTESSRVGKLERQLREVKEESRQKDTEIKKLKKDYESLKRDAKSRTAEAIQVLQDKNAKIGQLEKKLKDMEATNATTRPKSLDAAIVTHNKITQDLKSGIESLGKPSRYERTQRINRHARAASVEDMTLDMTQRSLLRDGDDYMPDDIRQDKAYGGGLLTDWTADIPTFELQTKDKKNRHEEADKFDENLIMEDTDAFISRQATKGLEQQSLLGNQRALPDVLSNRVNESSRRPSRRNHQLDTNEVFSTDRDQNNASRRITGARTATLAEEKAMMQGALLDQPTRRSRALSRTTGPVSSGNETPAIDLVQDRFKRLGGPSADRKHDESKLENEIAELESQLAEARQRLSTKRRVAAATETTDSSSRQTTSTASRTTPFALTLSSTPTIPDPSHHYLLLLSDSALPLGSFAFSSGLESYLAHARSPSSTPSLLYKPSFTSFLPLSLSSYASTSLPFVLAAYRDPGVIATLDDVLDASIICAVGRRASTAQGRALLSIWEKSLAPSSAVSADARSALEAFSAALRSSTSVRKAGEANVDEDALPPPVSAHLAPLFGAVAQLLGLTLRQTAYVFLFSHAKALVSAAVRASMFGPYQAQKILAGGELQVLIADMVEREWDVPVEEAGQSVPVMDLWIGRHEMLYSRIFNS